MARLCGFSLLDTNRGGLQSGDHVVVLTGKRYLERQLNDERSDLCRVVDRAPPSVRTSHRIAAIHEAVEQAVGRESAADASLRIQVSGSEIHVVDLILAVLRVAQE